MLEHVALEQITDGRQPKRSTVDNNAGSITITNSTLSPKAKVTSNGSPIHIVASPTSEECSGFSPGAGS